MRHFAMKRSLKSTPKSTISYLVGITMQHSQESLTVGKSGNIRVFFSILEKFQRSSTHPQYKIYLSCIIYELIVLFIYASKYTFS